ncbi:selenocysteine lyase/cysteine desulfurase [Sporohalobacter salinus]|nr:selenocysteine lyase/cysteine desulfurase [Sporohalobacter salinus]
MDNLRNHKLSLTDYLLTELGKMSKVKIYGPQNIQEQAPVVSFNLVDKMASEIGFILDRAFDIGIRSGLHCAPVAHRTLGTLKQGTVRISPGNFNNQADCDKLIRAVKDILE